MAENIKRNKNDEGKMQEVDIIQLYKKSIRNGCNLFLSVAFTVMATSFKFVFINFPYIKSTTGFDAA